MRFPLPTDLSTRDGLVTHDAKMQNCFVDGEYVYKRPATNSALATASGAAQNGLAANSLVFMINGDSLRSYNSSYVLQSTIAL